MPITVRTRHAAGMTAATACDVLETYRVTKDVFVLGSLSKGVTVYQQQCRALNLAWALAQESESGRRPLGDVAIIGAGVAGLTFCAALMSVCREPIHLLEQTWDLCPLQQGSETRWLHPELYDWPALGSRRPGAGMQVLDWNAGRAADVARGMLKAFAARCEIRAQDGGQPPQVYLGLGHLRVDAGNSELDWVGRRAIREESYFRIAEASGLRKRFGTIVLAGGFGIEADQPSSGSVASASYWRNDTLGQPILTGARHDFVVSGHGDGGVVDLCRLKIERFRQDTILGELFGDDLEKVEAALRAAIGKAVGCPPEEAKGGRVSVNLLQLMESSHPPISDILGDARSRLRSRLRKDARVTLHVKQSNQVWRINALFDNKSSFLNRMLLYLLYEVGGFDLHVGELDTFVARHNVPAAHVIQRHGTQTVSHLLKLFSDPESVRSRLTNMKAEDRQSPVILCDGFFPPDPR